MLYVVRVQAKRLLYKNKQTKPPACKELQINLGLQITVL